MIGEIIEKQFFPVNLYPSINCSCSVECDGVSAVLFVTTTGFAVLKPVAQRSEGEREDDNEDENEEGGEAASEAAVGAEVIENNLPSFGAEVVIGGISACVVSPHSEDAGVLVCLTTWGGTSSRVKSTLHLYFLSPGFSEITHLQTMRLQLLALSACVFHDDNLGTWVLVSLDDGTVRSLRFDTRKRALQTPPMRPQAAAAVNVVTTMYCGKSAAGDGPVILFGTSLGEVFVSRALDELFDVKGRAAAFAFDGPITSIKQLGDEYLIGVGLGFAALVHLSGNRKPLGLPGGFQHDTLQAIATGHVACDASADVALGFYDGSLLLCSREEHLAASLDAAYGDRSFAERCLKRFPFPVYGVYVGNFTGSRNHVRYNADGEVCVLATAPEIVVVTARSIHVLCYSEQPPIGIVDSASETLNAGTPDRHARQRVTETRPKLQRRIDTIATIFADIAAAVAPETADPAGATQTRTS